MDISAQQRAVPRYASEVEKQQARTQAQLRHLRTAFELTQQYPDCAIAIAATALNYIKTMRSADQGVSKC